MIKKKVRRYHSHHSWQYVEGFWGALIVDNTPEVYNDRYEEEMDISLTDWHHIPAKILSEGYQKEGKGIPVPDTGLINGSGYYPCQLARGKGLSCDESLQSPAFFKVNPGRTYRIRLINTSARSNFNFSIDGHTMTVIEVDAVDTVPVGPVDSVEIWPAQRYSVLVTINGILDEYWIQADMNARDPNVPQSKAVLQYNRGSCPSQPPLKSFGPSQTGIQGRPQATTLIGGSG